MLQTKTSHHKKNKNYYNYNTNDSNSKILKYYHKIAYSMPILKKDEEIDLLRKIKNNQCQQSSEIIVNAYLRTVISLAKKYCFGNNLSLEDAVQSGIHGILNSIQSFDLSKYKKIDKKTGSLFSYYCYRGILMEMTNFYRENIRQFSVPDSVNTHLYNINKIYKTGELNNFVNDLSNEKMSSFLSKKLNIKLSKVRELLHLFSPPVELDAPILHHQSEHENETSYKDFLIKTDKENNPLFITERENKYSYLLNLIETLPETDREIIKDKYGFNGDRHSVAEIASKYKISTFLASKTVKNIENKLKNSMISGNSGI